MLRFVKAIDNEESIELFGDGSQSRDFTFVDDIARGTIKALMSKGYHIINLGGGKNPISINDIIQWLEEMLGKKAKIDYKPFHAADMMETWADISKAKKIIDWQPTVSVKEGLKRTVDWYLANRDWVTEIKTIAPCPQVRNGTFYHFTSGSLQEIVEEKNSHP